MVVPDRSKEAMAMLALHEALRNVCLNYDWTYSVFWTIRPRPRCRGGTSCKVGEENGTLMLMWEDGFCQLGRSQNSSTSMMSSCRLGYDEMGEHSTSFETVEEQQDAGDPIWKAFRKMSIQLYNYGEGLMGKVASDKCHKWVFKESPECEVGISSYWQSSFDAHPPEWTDQFASGIQTIAVIQAGQGLLQLGSCKVVAEDLHFVLRMRHAFESLEYPSALFPPQPFATGTRNGAPAIYPASFLTPPPSPHSWSLCTMPSLENSRFRAGVFKEATDQKVAAERKDELAQSPRLSLNTGSSMTLDTSSSLHKQRQASPGKLWTDVSPHHHLINANLVAHGRMIQDVQSHHDHLLGGSSHVESPTSSKLYQRRSLMPKFHEGLPFLAPANSPSSISSIEALLAQRSHPGMPTNGNFLRQLPAGYPNHEMSPVPIPDRFDPDNQQSCMQILNAPENNTREDAGTFHRFPLNEGAPTPPTTGSSSMPTFHHPQPTHSQGFYDDKRTRNEQVCTVDCSNVSSLVSSHHVEGDFYSEMM